MRIEEIGQGVVLLSDCHRPVGPGPRRDEGVLTRLAEAGVASLLVIADDLTPWPSGQPGGLWCYVRPLVDPDAPSPSELQRVRDFVRFERSGDRTVSLWIGYERARKTVLDAATSEDTVRPGDRPLPSDPCCCRPYHEGCDGRLVCHAAPVKAAEDVLRSGALLSKHRLTGRPLEELSRGTCADGAGDPPDHFDYVNLANGNCVAPDIVASERRAGIRLRSEEIDADLYPGVRFFFDTTELFRHPRAAWDGIHPVKVKNLLELEPYLVAAVAPTVLSNGEPLELEAPPGLRGRIVRLDHREHRGLAAWSTGAFKVALTAAERVPGD